MTGSLSPQQEPDVEEEEDDAEDADNGSTSDWFCLSVFNDVD